MEWAVHEASREGKNDACRVLVDKSEGKRLPVRPGVNLRIIVKLNFTNLGKSTGLIWLRTGASGCLL
jgi:hypothetical protein